MVLPVPLITAEYCCLTICGVSVSSAAKKLDIKVALSVIVDVLFLQISAASVALGSDMEKFGRYIKRQSR